MVDLKAYRSLHKTNQYPLAPISELRDELGPEAMAREEPPDDWFELLLPPTIKGFNMRRKKWFDLIAERITDVKWNEDAFKKVVMNSKAKDLIQALVSHQLASEESTDLIANKGNGLILLLHGSPGTGKTLTAEGVAEITKKPLYRVTCADIGTKPEEAEKYLESILHLGKLWKCVVLLDEAVRNLPYSYSFLHPLILRTISGVCLIILDSSVDAFASIVKHTPNGFLFGLLAILKFQLTLSRRMSSWSNVVLRISSAILWYQSFFVYSSITRASLSSQATGSEPSTKHSSLGYNWHFTILL